jgi:ferredoxin
MLPTTPAKPAAGEGDRLVRVVVDMDVCESNGLCAGLAPSVFRLGDDDVLQVLAADVAAGDEAKVRAAARACPKQAIRVLED